MGNPIMLEVTCPVCGYTRDVPKGETRKKRFTGMCAVCNAHNQLSKLQHQKMEKHPRWKGGIQDNRRDGYLTITLPPDSPFIDMATSGNHVFLHRFVVAQHLGRNLKTNEIVHHLNGDRKDNRIENLTLVDVKKHEKWTLAKAFQKRIKELEEELCRCQENL